MMNPTAMELWFEGSFLCRHYGADVIRKNGTYYFVFPDEYVSPVDRVEGLFE